MWLNIPDEQVPVILSALRSSKGDRPVSELNELIAAKIEERTGLVIAVLVDITDVFGALASQCVT